MYQWCGKDKTKSKIQCHYFSKVDNNDVCQALLFASHVKDSLENKYHLKFFLDIKYFRSPYKEPY
jgi:hypothetical protein